MSCLVCLGGKLITLCSAFRAECTTFFGCGCLPHSQETLHPGRSKRCTQASTPWLWIASVAMQAGERVPAGPGRPFGCSNEVQGAEGDRGAAADDHVLGQ